MISFNYETKFQLEDERAITLWISKVITSEGFEEGDVNYIFCGDEFLHKLNVEFLNHDDLTDIISFDNTVGKVLQGDVYISVERVADNAQKFEVSFAEELSRVMVHGILHYCGYKDKSETDAKKMRERENHYLQAL
jgi:rRNA maturation RNase YbeY